MQLISNLIRDLDSYYALLIFLVNMFELFLWKIKKGVSIVDAFQKLLDDLNRKPNKIWIDKESKFHNNPFKKWLKDNDIKTYSIHNEGKSVVAERILVH